MTFREKIQWLEDAETLSLIMAGKIPPPKL